MRTPVGWALTARTSLQVLCACCAFWCTPVATLAAREQTTAMPVVSKAAPAADTSAANNRTTRVGGISLDRRVLTLLAMGCLVGLIAGWVRGGEPRRPRVRLYIKPRKTPLSVLVPPGPAPRLIPRESPNATQASWTRTPVSRRTRVGATRNGVIDYLAAFADSADASEEAHVDYLLIASDSAEESPELTDGFDDSLRQTG
jgi:hypothetical protein